MPRRLPIFAARYWLPWLSEEEAHKISVEAVVYGLPLVVMDLTKRVSTNVTAPSRTPTP